MEGELVSLLNCRTESPEGSGIAMLKVLDIFNDLIFWLCPSLDSVPLDSRAVCRESGVWSNQTP
jgi:hypothetical protein